MRSALTPEERIRASFEAGMVLDREVASTGGLVPEIARAAALLSGILETGGRLYCCGNGGSLCEAQHFASELANRFEQERRSLPALVLAEGATLTSVANDESYAEVFARPLSGLASAGDALVVFSTSGDSPNVVRAAEVAHDRGVRVVALSGRSGGRLVGRLGEGDVLIRVPSDRTARIQEVHLRVVHCLCELIDARLLGADAAR